MALIQMVGAYFGPEYNSILGDTAFLNYGTNTSDTELVADFPPTFCAGFAGILKFGTTSRDFSLDRNVFQFRNIKTGAVSTQLILPLQERLATVIYEDTGGGDFLFAASDRLQMFCSDALDTVDPINVNVSTWLEIDGDTDDYFMITAAAKSGFVLANHPFSFGAGVSNADPSGSTASMTIPFNSELTFGGITATISGRDTPVTSQLEVIPQKNGVGFSPNFILSPGAISAGIAFSESFNVGDTFGFELATTNANVISVVLTATFKIL